MPQRRVGEWRGWRQASSGAKRRCRQPGGASLSLEAHGEPAGAADTAAARLPTRSRLSSLNPTDAAHGAPPKRKVRKFDSLSAATKGPTTSILRLVLRCVNGGAGRDLESGVQGPTRAPARDPGVIAACARCGARRGETRCLARGAAMDTSQNRSHAPRQRRRSVVASDSRSIYGVRASCRFNSRACIECFASWWPRRRRVPRTVAWRA